MVWFFHAVNSFLFPWGIISNCSIKQNNNFNIVLALFRSGGEEIPEASGQVQQLTIQEEDGEELESEQEQEPDRIKIHEWVEMNELPVIRSLSLRKDF